MWMIFDVNKNFVGMSTEEAREETNIFDVLIDAGYYVGKVDSLCQADPVYWKEPIDED